MNGILKTVLRNLDGVLCAATLTVTIVLVIINVFTRYALGYIIVWSEEVATTCFVYTTFIGAAYVYRLKLHVGVDLLVMRLSDLPRQFVRIAVNTIMLVLNGYITYLSILFIQSAWIKRMPILKVSSAFVNFALTVGFGLMTIYAFFFWLESVRECFPGLSGGRGEQQ